MNTKIEKSKLKPLIIGENLSGETDYVDHATTVEMDMATLATLVKAIPKLDKKAHECIYDLIRTVKPIDFFATNGLGTHFNILNLNNKTKWEVHRLCQMSINVIDRKSVIKSADSQHETVLDTLEHTLCL